MTDKWVILAALATGALWADQALSQTPPTANPAEPKPAAVVNGAAIPMADVDAGIKARGGFRPNLPDAQRRDAQMYILGNLIDDLLLQQFLDKSGIKASPADVKKQIDDLEAALKHENKTLQDFCKDNYITEAKLRFGAALNAQWTSYLSSHVSDKDLKKFFDDARDFFDGTTVHVSHIMMKVAPNADEAQRKEVKDKLLAIRAHIVAGKLDFADAAKKYSQSENAASGGDLGFIQRKGDLEEPMAKAVFAMKAGEVSDVVANEFGLYLIKVMERKPGPPADFDKVKDRVQYCYVAELRDAILAEQRKAAKIEINLP
jgi:parvulin-like peptidyl-prolyl isomerase